MEVLQDTYKDTKIGRIPKDWDLMMLNEITNYKSSNLSLNKLEENTGKYKLYGASGMLKGIDFYQTDKESFAIVKDGSGFGNLLWCDKNSSILGTLGRITNKEISDLKFCFYLTHTIKFKRYMSGSTIPHLYYKDYGNIKIPVPPLPEQQKIAAILSTVDEQISTTNKIIEKSKELKKGLMQKLFSEGIGHTEFKDTKIGRIPKKWNYSRIEEHINLFYGNAFKSADFNEEGIGTKLLRGINITVGRLRWNKKMDRYLNLPYEDYTKYSAKEGDLVISMDGSLVGRNFARVKKSDLPLLIVQRVACVRTKKSLDLGYLNQLVGSVTFINYVDSVKTNSGIPHISGKDIKHFKIPLPSLQEQQKIAAILSEADAKIEKEQTQKAQLEALKKGLMQQLLTGKKRVKV